MILLRYNNYLHSNSVFIAESGQPSEPPFDRNFISKSLNIIEDSSSKKIPLLYSILFGLKKEVYEPNLNGINSNSVNVNSININPPYIKDQNISIKNEQPQPWIID